MLIPTQAKLLIFDWDGTLMNSEKKITSCLSLMIKELKLPSRDHGQLKSIIGLGLEKAIKTLFPIEIFDLKEAVAVYRKCYFQNKLSADNLFANAKNTIKTLAKKYQLSVATGKEEKGLLQDLKNTGLDKFFTTYRTARQTKNKPNPAMLFEILQETGLSSDEALMIGDTTFDLQMAQNAKMKSIGVSFGVHDTESLSEYKPITIIDDLQQLL
jgi:phosphoglycolate phosphatase